MKDSIIKNKNKIIYSLVWIGLWHILAKSIDNSILLPFPVDVFQTFFNLLREDYFWISIFNSVIKISFGLLLSILAGLILGAWSYKSHIIKEILDIPMSIIKSIPLASIVVILLVWLKSNNLPIIVVFLIVLPSIFYSTYEGLSNADRKLLEMAKIFEVDKKKIIKYIYLDKLKEYLIPSIVVGTGLAWKSGVSAEVLGLVKNSIGENIYYSKLYLDTRELFAWTIAIVILSKVFEKFIGIVFLKVDVDD